MSSIARSVLRRRLRKNGLPFKGRPQIVEFLDDGGYRTLRPTKGWIKVSGKRLKHG